MNDTKDFKKLAAFVEAAISNPKHPAVSYTHLTLPTNREV